MTCPGCGSNTFQVSQNFKAPRKSDKREWRKVQELVLRGFRFQPVDGAYPKDLRGLEGFLCHQLDWMRRNERQRLTVRPKQERKRAEMLLRWAKSPRMRKHLPGAQQGPEPPTFDITPDPS